MVGNSENSSPQGHGTDKYATLDSGGSGLCLQENLTTGSCYQQNMWSHMFTSSDCTPGFVDPIFKVALRRDGVDNPGLCTGDQQTMDYPDPPLTYCLDVLLLNRPVPTH